MEATATQSSRRYFCHHCNTTISHTLPDYECPQCNQGFIEKLPDGPSPSASLSERNNTNGDELSSMVLDSVSNNMGNILEVMFSRNEGIPGGNSNDRPSSSSRNPSSGRNTRRQNQATLEHVLAEFLGMSQNGAYTDNNGPIFLVSNPGDYAWGREGLDTIVTQLFNQMDSSGPPPLAKEKIQELPYISVTKEQVSENTQCSVCWDLFRIEDKVRQLPCEHIYHDPCIVPWLQLHGTCPICRKLLSEEGDRISGFAPGGSLEALLRDAQSQMGGWSYANGRRNLRRCFQCNGVGHLRRDCPFRYDPAAAVNNVPNRWNQLPGVDELDSRRGGDGSGWNSNGDLTSFELFTLLSGDDADASWYQSDEDYNDDDDMSDYLFTDSESLREATAPHYFFDRVENNTDSYTGGSSNSASHSFYVPSSRNPSGRNATSAYRKPRSTKCYNCDQLGHFARDCPRKAKPRCDNCFKFGHKTSDCWSAHRRRHNYSNFNTGSSTTPQSSSRSRVWRNSSYPNNSNFANSSSFSEPSASQYDRSSIKCWNCNRTGHRARDCSQRRPA